MNDDNSYSLLSKRYYYSVNKIKEFAKVKGHDHKRYKN